MKEYIEKAAARNAVKRVIGDQDHICKAMMDFYVALNEVPVAEVVEVRHGRWIDVSGESSNLNWKCSLCTKRVLQKSPYCPNCGARMNKEDEHEAG